MARFSFGHQYRSSSIYYLGSSSATRKLGRRGENYSSPTTALDLNFVMAQSYCNKFSKGGLSSLKLAVCSWIDMYYYAILLRTCECMEMIQRSKGKIPRGWEYDRCPITDERQEECSPPYTDHSSVYYMNGGEDEGSMRA